MAAEVEGVAGGPSCARPRVASRVRRVAFVALALWPFVAWGAARGLVARAAVDKADALVVLSGSAAYEERVAEAARLFVGGRARLILLTDDGVQGGWSEAEQRNPRFVELAADGLRLGGVPTEQIRVLAERPTNTYREADAVRAYAEGQGLRSLLVVTSSHHSRRALWTWRRVFRGSGVRIGLEPARGARTPGDWSWWLSAAGWREVAGEYVKMGYYVVRY
ncbi:MAG TPA: YdcF family protein [Pyrinomonadaceae bacterium]